MLPFLALVESVSVDIYTERSIDIRFAKVPEALHAALVEANALRLRRLYYQRPHRLSIQNPETTSAVVQHLKWTESTPDARFVRSVLPKPAKTNKMPAPSLVPANATIAQQTALAAIYAIFTTEVPRTKGVLINHKPWFPPIPPTRQCPYCGVIVEFENTAGSLLWQYADHPCHFMGTCG